MSTVSEKLKIISDALEKIRKVLVKKGFFTDNIYPNITEYANYIDNWNGVNATDLINYIERRTDVPGYIANGLKGFVGSKFYNNSFITTFEANDMTELRGGLSSIGSSSYEDGMFESCENLRSVKMNAIETIYLGSSNPAFIENCHNIVNVEMNSLAHVLYYATNAEPERPSYFIRNCSSLQNITLPALQQFGSQFISYCPALTYISLPVCTKLGSGAFEYNKNLKTIDAPMLEEIGHDPFNNSPNIDLKNGNLFPNLKVINGYFIRNKTNVTEINIPTLEVINGKLSFSGNKQVTRLNLPKLKSINKDNTSDSNNGQTFSVCSQLESVSFPELNFIYSYELFNECYLLKNVEMPNLETLMYKQDDYGEFHYTQVKKLDLSNLKKIEAAQKNVFSGNDNPIIGGMIALKIPNVVSIIGNKPLRATNEKYTQEGQSVWSGNGTKIKTGWNNYTANNLETIDIYYYSPFYYESSLTWVDFPALKEIICRSTTAPSSLFLNTGLKRFWLPKNTIKTITAQTLTQAPFYNLGDNFEIWTDFASEEEINEANVPNTGTINFGQYWANISSDQKATIQYGKTHEEYREEVARLDGGTVKPEFDEPE